MSFSELFPFIGSGGCAGTEILKCKEDVSQNGQVGKRIKK